MGSRLNVGRLELKVQATLPPSEGRVIHAAGGLLWRRGENGRELVLIHRLRHGDEWALPKGKLDPGESWEMGALREVREETGYEARVCSFAGGQIYRVNGQPKVVLYWHMQTCGGRGAVDVAEIVEVAWFGLDAARARMTHESERLLLAEALATAPVLG
jgi:8-oxo-dGTP pyrophosphatase MutT (NUDIX family)